VLIPFLQKPSTTTTETSRPFPSRRAKVGEALICIPSPVLQTKFWRSEGYLSLEPNECTITVYKVAGDRFPEAFNGEELILGGIMKRIMANETVEQMYLI
jgi:hypothetical protein